VGVFFRKGMVSKGMGSKGMGTGDFFRHIPLPEYLNDPAKGTAGAVLLLDD
jgi:hypothetical protein